MPRGLCLQPAADGVEADALLKIGDPRPGLVGEHGVREIFRGGQLLSDEGVGGGLQVGIVGQSLADEGLAGGVDVLAGDLEETALPAQVTAGVRSVPP